MSHKVFLLKYLNGVLRLLLGTHHTSGKSRKQVKLLFIRALCQRTKNLDLQYSSMLSLLSLHHTHRETGGCREKLKHWHLDINLGSLLSKPHIGARGSLRAAEKTERTKFHRSIKYIHLPEI